MSNWSENLIKLLPAVYQLRDAEQKFPLASLMRVIGEQMDIVHDDIQQMQENWFIETCEASMVPYIGDLVSFRREVNRELPPVEDLRRAAIRNRLLFPRSEVANAVRLRRRKGTLKVFESLAKDIAGWQSEVKDLSSHEARTNGQGEAGQRINMMRLPGRRVIDEEVEKTSRLIELNVWRNIALPITRAMARPCDGSPRKYHVDPRGINAPLFVASDHGPPQMLSNQMLQAENEPHVNDEHYGEAKSFAIYQQSKIGRRMSLVPAHQVATFDSVEDPNGDSEQLESIRFLIDANQGVLLARDDTHALILTSHFVGAMNDVGGSERSSPGVSRPSSSVPPTVARLRANFDEVLGPEGEKNGDLDQGLPMFRDGQFSKYVLASRNELTQYFVADTCLGTPVVEHLIIELGDSSTYRFNMGQMGLVRLLPGQTLELRSRNSRPIIRFEELTLFMAQSSHLVLDGVHLEGCLNIVCDHLDDDEIEHHGCRAAKLCSTSSQPDEQRHRISIRNSTLRSGSDNEVALKIGAVALSPVVTINNSILGAMKAITNSKNRNGRPHFEIADSILMKSVELENSQMNLFRSTALGVIDVRAFWGQDSILYNTVTAHDVQNSGARFCSFVNIESRGRLTCYECSPEDPDPEAVRPVPDAIQESNFSSLDYGHPGFCLLQGESTRKLRTRSEDESEPGVFHDLYLPQRESNLREWVSEFTPVSMKPVINYMDQEFKEAK